MHDELTLVLDIGKSHAKLLMIDGQGGVVERHGRSNRSVMSPLGYPALDLFGLTQWIGDTLRGLDATRRCTRAIASTHGAAFVALGDEGLAWAPIDYEFEGVDATRAECRSARDAFELTLSPDLPAGLNAACQLYWLQHVHPETWARTKTLLPYPQYWAWWLSGVAASEVSSLGCHTQLWQPAAGRFSDLARAQGWADLFAPLQPAWHTLGRVRPDRARDLGLPESCEVFCGVHDSNACLARYLHDAAAMTLVSTGTWVVAMAPGAATASLDPARDMLANVSVRGEVVPTARFMGGREIETLCAGAAPHLASVAALAELLAGDWMALPPFATQGGPFAGRAGRVLRGGVSVDPAALAPVQRATLAALYAAQVTAELLERLGAAMPVVLEGPFADNPVCVHVLAALLPRGALHLSKDTLEGTARGAWKLTRWGEPAPGSSALKAVDAPAASETLRRYHSRWRARLATGFSS